MQVDRNRELIRMFVERIIDKAFSKETAAARLQQVGLFTLIYMLESEEEPVTAARLARITGLSDAQVITHLRKLIKRKLIKRATIKNRQGRGRAFQLSINHTKETKRLLQAIGKGGAGKR
jgi:predicted ArsR family transcriptional regulator